MTAIQEQRDFNLPTVEANVGVLRHRRQQHELQQALGAAREQGDALRARAAATTRARHDAATSEMLGEARGDRDDAAFAGELTAIGQELEAATASQRAAETALEKLTDTQADVYRVAESTVEAAVNVAAVTLVRQMLPHAQALTQLNTTLLALVGHRGLDPGRPLPFLPSVLEAWLDQAQRFREVL